MLQGLFRKKEAKTKPLDIILYDKMADGDTLDIEAAVNGREVAIFRPPVMLDVQGNSMPGVDRNLIARYLVSVTAAMAQADLGPVEVEWRQQQGRFCETAFHIHTWGQTIEMVHPIAPVSQSLANTWEVYKAGIALKARELHKGHQRFGQANALIEQASRKLDRLRDDEMPHFSDAEYLFLQTQFQKAQVMSALLPTGEVKSERVNGILVLVQ